jgi:CheY-like chemotaxis protein
MRAPYILIVDDDASVRKLIRRMLGSIDNDILDAASAEDAMAMIAQWPPAVAFCDVHMPAANGLWLADQIRRLAPTTAIVLATGDADIPPPRVFFPGSWRTCSSRFISRRSCRR